MMKLSTVALVVALAQVAAATGCTCTDEQTCRLVDGKTRCACVDDATGLLNTKNEPTTGTCEETEVKQKKGLLGIRRSLGVTPCEKRKHQGDVGYNTVLEALTKWGKCKVQSFDIRHKTVGQNSLMSNQLLPHTTAQE